MLNFNQKVSIDFALKDNIYIKDFKYKEGEIDPSGIEVSIKNLVADGDDTFLVNWLYRDEYDYIYIPNLGVDFNGEHIVVRPPQETLRPGLVGFEIVVAQVIDGHPVAQIKGPSVLIEVEPSLVSEGNVVVEDATISESVSIIEDQTELKDILTNLNAFLEAQEAARAQAEAGRQSLANTKNAELDAAKLPLDAAITAANAAKSNANSKTTLANTATSSANTATTAANTATTNATNAKESAITATANANSKTSAANTAKTSADSAKTNADAKTSATNASTAALVASTSTANSNTTNLQGAPAEVSAARVDGLGGSHGNVKEAVDANYNELVRHVPKNLSFKGIETITADNTVPGNVNNCVVSGETLVNRYPLSGTKGTWSSAPNTFNDWAHPVHGVALSSLKMGSTYTAICFDKLGELSRSTTLRYRLLNVHGKNTQFSFSSPWKPTSFIAKQDDPAPNNLYFIFALGTFNPIMSTSYAQENITIMLLEGDHTDKPLEFFEGLKSAEISEVETHGVNLWDNEETIYGIYLDVNGDITAPSASGLVHSTSGFIRVKPSVTYKQQKTGVVYCEYDKDKRMIGQRYVLNGAQNFTTTQSAVYIRVSVSYNTKFTDNTLYEVNPNTPTKYIPFESTKLTTHEPVILRSLPNGVADTLDLETGELTRRCGEAVLDGSADEGWRFLAGDETETLIWFSGAINIKDIQIAKTGVPGGITSDKFAGKFSWENENEGIYTTGVQAFPILIYIAKSKLTTPNLAGFKAWLANNPTKAVYQLATPTTEIIDLDGYLKSHDYQTTITAPSVIPAKLSADIPINLKTWLESQQTTLQTAALQIAEDAEALSTLSSQNTENQDTLTQLQMATIEIYESRI